MGLARDCIEIMVKVALYSMAHDKFMCRDCPHGDNEKGSGCCDRDAIGGWETFDMEECGDGKVAFKTDEGNYISALNEDSDWTLAMFRDTSGGWEQFEIQLNPDGDRDNKGVYLKSDHDGRYLCATDEGKLILSEPCGGWGWEQFKICVVGL